MNHIYDDKKINYLIIIVLFLFVCSCGSKVETGELHGIELNKIGLKKINVNVRLPISNKSLYDINITDIDIALRLEDDYYGMMKNTKSILLKKRSTDLHTINCDIFAKNIVVKSAKLLGLLRKEKVKVALKGTISAKTFFTKKTIYIDEVKEVDLFR